MIPKFFGMKDGSKGQVATHAGPKPGDFPIGSLESRAAARAALETGECLRMVVCHIGQALDTRKSSCTRTIWPNGILFEMVELHGSSKDLSDGQLEAFIRSHSVVG